MADEDSSDKKSMQRSHRAFRVGLRKWLKTSKRTEWLSSLTTPPACSSPSVRAYWRTKAGCST